MDVVLTRAQEFIPSAASVTPLGEGAINRTYLVCAHDDEQYVLQRMSHLFTPALMDDLVVLTPILKEAGVVVPEYLPSNAGTYAFIEKEAWWRMMMYIPGEVHQRVPSDVHAESAVRFLAHFEKALWNHSHEFVQCLQHYHEYEHDVTKLARALESPAAQEKRSYLNELLEQRDILAALVVPSLFTSLPTRIVHGDPKISNFVFEGEEVKALLDLDVIGRRSVATDLGDLMRSMCWCGDEDDTDAGFSFERANRLYAAYLGSVPQLTQEELEVLPRSCAYLALMLATRFLTDAINESYFVLQEDKYASLFKQCSHRARVQIKICEEALAWAEKRAQ